MKKIVASIIVLIFVIGINTKITDAQVSKHADFYGHYAQNEILEWLEKDYMSLDEEGNFNPNLPISRAELAVILDRIFDIPNKKSNIKAVDLDSSHWAYYSLIKFINNEYMGLNPKTESLPGSKMTRQEVVEILVKLFELKGSKKLAYKDNTAISKSNLIYYEVLEFHNIKLDTNNDLRVRPSDNITRGEFVFIVSDIIKKVKNFENLKPRQIVHPVEFSIPNYGQLEVYKQNPNKGVKANGFDNNTTKYYITIPKQFFNRQLKLNVKINKQNNNMLSNNVYLKLNTIDSEFQKHTFNEDGILTLKFNANAQYVLNIGDYSFFVNVDNGQDKFKLVIGEKSEYHPNNYIEMFSNAFVHSDKIYFTVEPQYTKNNKALTTSKVFTSGHLMLFNENTLLTKGKIKYEVTRKGRLVEEGQIEFDFSKLDTTSLTTSDIKIEYKTKEEISKTNNNLDISPIYFSKEYEYFAYSLDLADYITNKIPNGEWFTYSSEHNRFDYEVIKEEGKWLQSNINQPFFKKSEKIYYSHTDINRTKINAEVSHLVHVYDKDYNLLDVLHIKVDVPSQYIRDGVSKAPKQDVEKLKNMKPLLTTLKINGSNKFHKIDELTDKNYRYTVVLAEELYDAEFDSSRSRFYYYYYPNDGEEFLFDLEWDYEDGLEISYYEQSRGKEILSNDENGFKLLLKDHSLYYFGIFITVKNPYTKEENTYSIYVYKIIEFSKSYNFENNALKLNFDPASNSSQLMTGDEIQLEIPASLSQSGKDTVVKHVVKNNVTDYYYFTNKSELRRGDIGTIKLKVYRNNVLIHENQYVYDLRPIKIFKSTQYTFKYSPFDRYKVDKTYDRRGGRYFFAGIADLSSIPNAKYAFFEGPFKDILDEIKTNDDYLKHHTSRYEINEKIRDINSVDYNSYYIVYNNNYYEIEDTETLYFIILDENKKFLGIAELQVKLTMDTVSSHVTGLKPRYK